MIDQLLRARLRSLSQSLSLATPSSMSICQLHRQSHTSIHTHLQLGKEARVVFSILNAGVGGGKSSETWRVGKSHLRMGERAASFLSMLETNLLYTLGSNISFWSRRDIISCFKILQPRGERQTATLRTHVQMSHPWVPSSQEVQVRSTSSCQHAPRVGKGFSVNGSS